MNFENILCTRKEGLVFITINRPKKLNNLDSDKLLIKLGALKPCAPMVP